MSEVEWSRLPASSINALAERGAVVIVPVASTEQHGPHLATAVDSLLVGEVARRAAALSSKTTPTLVTPTVWTGLAEHHMSLGGTLSLDFQTFFLLLSGITRSLVRQGFRRVLLLNGHGGNVAALTVVVNELAVELNVPISTASYWQLADTAFAQILDRQKTVRHACEAETSMMLALRPDLVDMSLADVEGPTEVELSTVTGTAAAYRWRSFKSRTRHGVIGYPKAATADKGERLLDAAANSVSRLVGNEAFWDLPA